MEQDKLTKVPENPETERQEAPLLSMEAALRKADALADWLLNPAIGIQREAKQ